jgi:hypothetical protein
MMFAAAMCARFRKSTCEGDSRQQTTASGVESKAREKVAERETRETVVRYDSENGQKSAAALIVPPACDVRVEIVARRAEQVENYAILR